MRWCNSKAKIEVDKGTLKSEMRNEDCAPSFRKKQLGGPATTNWLRHGNNWLPSRNNVREVGVGIVPWDSTIVSVRVRTLLRDFNVNCKFFGVHTQRFQPALHTNRTFLTLLQCSPLYEYTLYTQLSANRTYIKIGYFIGVESHMHATHRPFVGILCIPKS